jgi:hypothetical protein
MFVLLADLDVRFGAGWMFVLGLVGCSFCGCWLFVPGLLDVRAGGLGCVFAAAWMFVPVD